MAKTKKEKVEKKKASKEELEKVIVDLAKKEMTPSKIGLVLRKEYGVKSEKKIKRILAEKGIKSDLPEELDSLIKRANALQKHLLKNKMDKVARRGLEITRAKIIQLGKYFKKKHVLPQNWEFKA